MQCPRCRAENRAGRRFCGECGLSLALTCPSCGFLNDGGEKFCGGCGAAMAPSAAASGPSRSPDSYTPKHLAEKILTSRAALEGERKQVTVLFADLKGSMEMLADRDPEEARKVLDPVLELMIEAVHRYEGTVNQVMGDGIMALFGAPIGHENHAVRACYAALRMQRRIKFYADEVQREGGTPVQIRVGLNSGDVIVRSIGSDLHMDYIAVGQTTHLAARMEQTAKPGSVLATGDTLNLAKGYVQVRPLGAVTVKGLATATEVYELIGIRQARSRLQASAVRGLTPFVGRENELEQLAQALEHAAAGHGQSVAIVGEAGVGKSRLVWQFTRSHRTDGWLMLESAAVSYRKATPYLPIIELLKSYFRIQDRDDQREIRERVAGKLLMLDRALEPLLSPLLALLDIPVGDKAWDALDPPQRRQRILAAVRRLLLRESQIQPLLLLLEDLHWIDSETRSLLDGLIESLPTARVLLLVTYRPEYEHGWGRKTHYRQVRIDPLPSKSAGELLNALLGEDRTLEPLKRLLIERTEGNPFFLEESVWSLVETEVLVGERGAYRMAKAPEALQIPATVRAILAARIDRLAPEDKRLLQAASVIGKDVLFSLLQAITDVPEESLRQGLNELQTAEFLYGKSLFPDLEYTFKHALTHDVAYGSVLQDRRRALHVRIVEAIEALYPERLTEQVERLAHHALRGELWEQAVTYLRGAGLKAADRSAHREAVILFDQALGVLEHLPRSQQWLEQAIDLRLDLRSSLNPLGQVRRVYNRLREAEGMAEGLGDQRRQGMIAAPMAQVFAIMGDYDRAIESGERALSLALMLDDLVLQIQTNHYLSQAHWLLGNYRSVIDALTRSVVALTGNRMRHIFGMATYPAVGSRCMLAVCLAELGEFDDASSRAEEALRLAHTLDHPYTLIYASWTAAAVHLRRGNYHAAVPLCERAVILCRQREIPRQLPPSVGFLGSAYALAGRAADALPVLEEGDAIQATWLAASLLSCQLAEAYYLIGRCTEARKLAARGLEVAMAQKERGHQAWLLRLLGELLAQGDSPDLDAARVHYDQARALAEALGMRPLVAHCHAGLAKLDRRTGREQEAQEHFTTATAMYRAMGMTYWLERAQAEVKVQ